jgi:thymidylate kinase
MGNQKIVIFVGPDRCGKTNIIEELSRRTNIPTFKAKVQREFFVGDRKNFLPFLRYGETTILDMVEQTGQSVLFDRLWPCEWVYSRCFGRETDDSVVAKLDERYAALNALIVVCHRSSYAGIEDDDDPSVKQSTLEKLDSLYREFAEQSKTRCRFLNVDDENLEREVSEVLHWMEE